MSGIFTYGAIWSYTHVWSEEDKDVTVVWHVMTVGLEAGVSNEGDASKTAHVEALSPVVSEASVETRGMMIDLINANTAGK